MSMPVKANVAIIVISTAIALWAFFMLLPTNPKQLEDSRKEQLHIFCAHGRQWVEFQNGNATWGAMMLDIDGKPVQCNSIMDTKHVKG